MASISDSVPSGALTSTAGSATLLSKGANPQSNQQGSVAGSIAGAVAGLDSGMAAPGSHSGAAERSPGIGVPATPAPTTLPAAAASPANISGAHTSPFRTLPADSSRAAGAQASMTASSAFAAMDRVDSAPASVLLHSAPHQVAVGVTDPGLGWIEVRAERIAGQMTAALTANSAASHAELSAALPAMASYLNEHHHAVQHIHVQTGLAGGQNPGGSQSNSQGNAAGQQSREGGKSEPVAAIAGAGEGSRAQPSPAVLSAIEGGQRSRLEGRQFSVRA